MSTSVPSDTTGPLYYGRYSDGRTAASEDADVRLGAAGIEIGLAKRNVRLLWPYLSLATAEPLTEHAIDALLTSTTEPGATLFLGDGAGARKLIALAPHLSARSQRWRHARPWVAAAAIVALLTLATYVLDLSPARAVAGLLPERARESMGDSVFQSMTEGRRVCEGRAGRITLDRLTERLATAVPEGKRFRVVVVDWGLMNAFAVPGERIVLTRGLIEKAESADEVAGVLAHEMGHGIELHPETGVVRAIGLSAAAQLLLGGSGGTLANLGITLAELSYSRQAEAQADRHAFRILKGAGIAPLGFGDFFRRVLKEEGSDPIASKIGRIDILRTHPPTDERLREVERQPGYAATPALSAGDWRSLKGICDQAGPNPETRT